MLSDETARLLEFISSFVDGAPQNQFPTWAAWRDIDDLERRGLISFSTLVPPNKEPEYPRGLYVAHITTAGRDALAEKQRADNEMRNQAAQYEEEKHAHSRERKLDFLRDLIVLLIGSAITLLVEHVLFQ